ncbi:MAG: aminotransferase class I/II-fold pyridoxal phosphate-dependent enzyme [Enhygromyxa sp.]
MSDIGSWQARDLSHFRTGEGRDIFGIHQHFSDWVEDARPGGYYLYDLFASSAPGPDIRLAHTGDRPLLNLASYNYLGLAQDPRVLAAASAALAHYGLGAAGSPYLSGHMRVHDQLAQAIADFKGVEAALLFPTGYSANVGTIAALLGPHDVVIADILAHASILDGCALSRARLSLFRHNDPRSLARKLEQAGGRVLVIVEGVYSMDGDVAPLAEISDLCRHHGARLLVDEAHSAFIYGQNGRGLAEHFGVEDRVDVHIGTLSKSLGGMGGYVAGSRELIDYLRAYSRSQVFSCALAPAVAGGVLEALRIASAEPQRRARLWDNVARMRGALREQGVDVGDSSSQVIPIMVNDDNRVFAVAERLLAAGIYLNPVRYPAVKRNRSRLRVSISAAHEGDELERAAAQIAEVLRELEVLT